MNNIVLVNQSGSKYLFSVPESIQLKEGDKVKCDTRRGITDGVCFTDSVTINASALPLVCKLTGATLPLKEIVGKVVTSVEMFNKPVEKPSQPIAPQEDKGKFKVGQRVIATDNTRRFIKQTATILNVDKSDRFTPFEVKFDKRGLIMWCHSGDVEPYVEPEQPKSKYERMSNDELKRLACGISELCCPTLSNKKRKSDCPFYHTRCEVTNENRGEIIQYLIDEETPEPEKEPEPVYWSGKVVCTEWKGTYFTTGKVYDVVGGYAKDNFGRRSGGEFKLCDGNIKYHSGKFIPYLGEA